MSKKRIALITNGVEENHPDALDEIIRQRASDEIDVDIFDVRNLQQTDAGFETLDGEAIDPRGYDMAVRIIMGGVSGDSKKSWTLQGAFQEHGATAYTSIEETRGITDKIRCREGLRVKRVPLIPAIEIDGKDALDLSRFRGQLAELGEPPYVVRKAIGSGTYSFVVVDTPDAAIAAMEEFRVPASANGEKSGVLIHHRQPLLSADIAQRYDLGEISELDRRSYQFRVLLVDGEMFGTCVSYSEPGSFGLNPVQNAKFKAIPDELVPPEVLVVARKAIHGKNIKVLAVDVALDAQSGAYFLDMNASPDLSLVNCRGERLSHVIGKNICETLLSKGKWAGSPHMEKPADLREL